MKLHQITLHTRDRLPLGADERLARAIVRAVARVLGPDGLLFCVVDEHIHSAVVGDSRLAGAKAAALSLSLKPLVGAPIASAHVSEIDGRRHLETLVRYFARQSVKHGLPGHPAAWTGSCLPNLVGVRATPGFDGTAIRRALPRLTSGGVLRRVELGEHAIEPADEELVFEAGPVAVRDAAAAALTVLPDERTAAASLARAVAARLLEASDYSAAVVARAVGVSPSAVRKMRVRPIDPAILDLVCRRITFDRVVGAAPPVQPNDRELEAMRRSPFR